MSQMSTQARLVYMANQIAMNFAVAGRDAAAVATADHIATFWDPRMRSRILAQLGDTSGDGPGEEIRLSAIARQAIELLASRGAPPHQTRATVFAEADEAGGSDAG